MRLVLLLGSLAAAFGLAVLTTQTPAPLPSDAPAAAFSATRAMGDVRAISQAPHPLGSSEHARVQSILLDRMTRLGLQTSIQRGVLSPAAIARLARYPEQPSGELWAVNLVGVLPGRDPSAPAIVLMAHYDTVPGSPGAADDGAGVAAVLETVRAIRARGPAARTLVVLLTDAEELNLDGARAFFSEHPLRDRVGAVVNLEARGGGGRAMMFETGPGNAPTIDLYARAVGNAPGGPSSNSLAVFIYRLTPYGTDFTIPARRGAAGMNLAFIGRPALYHSPEATPDALDQGALQHLGGQALEAVDALLRAPALPTATENAVHGDVFGLAVVRHAPQTGWTLLIVAAVLTAFAGWGARHATGLTGLSVLRGAAGGLWLVSTSLVVAQAVRVLAGPVGRRVDTPETYYTLLRRLPWMEVGIGLSVLAVAFALLAGRALIGRRVLAVAVVLFAVLAQVLGELDPVVAGAAVVSVGLTFYASNRPSNPASSMGQAWGGWLGLIALVLLLGVVVQVAAPEAALLFIWPGLVAATAAAATALIGARLERRTALIPAVVTTVVVGGWLLAQGHAAFLGVGMDLPGALGVIALLVVMLARPLAPVAGGGARTVAAAGAACLILACGLSLAARTAEPVPPPGAVSIP